MQSSNRRAWNGVVGWKGGEALIYNVLACLAWLGSDKAENSQKVNTDGGLDPPRSGWDSVSSSRSGC